MRTLAGPLTLVFALCGCGPGGTASDGGSVAICGDGSKHDDELCDDGNLIAGDGCSPECNPSGMPYDCVDLLTQDSLDDADAVHDLLPLADGSFIAAGQQDVLGDSGGWVARYDPSGAQRWFVDTSALDSSFSTISALAGDEQSGIWALGRMEGASSQSHVLRLDPDGNIVSVTLIESEAAVRVDVQDIEVTAAGVWLGGAYWPGGLGTKDTWLGLLDPALSTVRDVLLEDHLGYDDTINKVVGDGEGVAVAATLSTSPHVDVDVLLMAKTDILVVWFDQHGNELRRTAVGPSPDPEFVRHARRLVVDGSGRWFVGGYLEPVKLTQRDQGWVVQVEGPWAWINPSSGVSGMVGVDDGIIVGGNLLLAPDSNAPFYQGWLGEYAWDGAGRWEFGVMGDDIADYKHYSHWVLVREIEGRIRTAGTLFVPEEPAVVRSCLVSR